eukprot:CAMPEP_0119259132 /NCGR_PEP_ID=MMETSP1329-20130426/69_1 /TAXON_ID=114041 /ORGANISM="Genus nov. species nov., Strain RCC1024" /LENGTH=236 /DNA_ID=CAMNT_0007258495 /DNA_START=168 /DNA_END=878 /DNA_ORIENTATION=+
MAGMLVATHAVCRYAMGWSHLASHAIPQFLGFCALAVLGATSWLEPGGLYTQLASTPAVLAPGPVGALVCALQIPFQIYELLCAFGVKRLRGKAGEMIAHHALSLLLASLAYNKGIYYYYGAYFFGISELSSVPLAFLDAFKMFPDLRKAYPKTNAFVRPFFCVVFLGLRTLYWPVVSYHFWKASLAHWPNDQVELLVFMTVNVVLTSLQAYWSYLIVRGLIKLVQGKDDGSGKDD